MEFKRANFEDPAALEDQIVYCIHMYLDLKRINREDPAGSRANLEGLLGYYEYIYLLEGF